MSTPEQDKEVFARRAAERSPSPLAEFLRFALRNKKWWLTPIIIVLALIAVLVVIGGTGMAPFIYSLF